MTDLAIVIPVYNEAENIIKCISEIENKVRVNHVINIVYDSEQDTTIPVIEAERDKFGCEINLVKNKYGKGVLNAIKTGLDTADGEFVVVTMADLSDPPKVINEMLDIAKSKNADIVCASRYMKGGRQIGGPFIKGLMSRFAGLSLHYFAGVKTCDATNSFKLYRKSFLTKQTIESCGGFELGLELVVKAHIQGKIVCETPTSWTDRTAGKSNFKLVEWLPHYLKWYFKAFRG